MTLTPTIRAETTYSDEKVKQIANEIESLRNKVEKLKPYKEKSEAQEEKIIALETKINLLEQKISILEDVNKKEAEIVNLLEDEIGILKDKLNEKKKQIWKERAKYTIWGAVGGALIALFSTN